MEGVTTISIDMLVPEKMKLATILQNELSTDFEEATVEWVDCPDLTQHPFYLAAPGLCGDTALLDIGGISNLFPLPKKEKVFHIKNILKKLNRIQYDNFIIGGGLCTRQADKRLGQLIMNASFASTTDKSVVLRNRSRFATIYFRHIKKREKLKRITRNRITIKPLTDENPNCNIYGNFFVSNGLREQVLKIQAKKRVGRDFIDALQHATRRFPHKTDSQLIGFGGIFMVTNGKAFHHVIRNWTHWDPAITQKQINEHIKFCNVETPMMGFATFVSTDRHIVNINPGFKQVFLTRSRAHGYCTNDGGHYHRTTLNYNTEYLGYFSPASKLYRIDPVPMFHEMVDFSCFQYENKYENNFFIKKKKKKKKEY